MNTNQPLTAGMILRLAWEYQTIERWRQVSQVARTLYGPAARQATISIISEPDTNHSVYHHLTFRDSVEIIACDEHGTILNFDFTQPWWHKFSPASDLAIQPEVRLAIRDLVAGQLQIEFLDTRWEQANPVTYMFDLGTPPAISHPMVRTSPKVSDGVTLSPADVMQLGREHRTLHHWKRVKQYVATLYGPRAQRVEISEELGYNDEFYNEEPHIRVTDNAGKRLRFDFSLPWWQRFRVNHKGYREYCEEAGDTDNIDYILSLIDADRYDYGRGRLYHALHDLTCELLGFEFQEYWNPDEALKHDVVGTYTLDSPPIISYPEVFAILPDEKEE